MDTPNPPTCPPIHPADRLLELLREEEQLLESTRLSLNELRMALRRGKMDTLKTIIHHQNALADQLRVIADERSLTANELGWMYGIPKANCTLKNLSKALSDPWSSQFIAIRARLNDLTIEIKKIRDANAILLDSLRFFFRDVLTSLTPEPATPIRYGPSGARIGSALATGFAGNG